MSISIYNMVKFKYGIDFGGDVLTKLHARLTNFED